MVGETIPDQATAPLQVEPAGEVRGMEFRQREDGQVEFHYLVEGGKEKQYPDFDGQWRVMTEADQRATLRLGGRVADWLRSLQ